MITTDDIKTIHCIDAGSQRYAIDLYGVAVDALDVQMVDTPYVLVCSYGEHVPLKRLINHYDQATGTDIKAITDNFAEVARGKYDGVNIVRIDSGQGGEMPSGQGGRVAWEEGGYRSLRTPIAEIGAYSADGACVAYIRIGYILDDKIRVVRPVRPAKAQKHDD